MAILQPKFDNDTRQVPYKILKEFVEHAPVAIAMFDLSMNYIAVSQRWLEECNVTSTQIIGQCHYDVVPSIPERWRKIHAKALQGAYQCCDEDSFELPSGKTEWLRWEVQPWYRSDNVIGGITMFVEHITKRKFAEQKIKQLVSRLNKSNQELKRFASICSHDLKAPVRNLANFTQLLQQNYKDENDPQIQYYWRVINENIGRMEEMIRAFLLYAELGAKGLQKKQVDVNNIIKKIKLTLASLIAEKGAIVQTSSLPTVAGDEVMLTQVFHNLISNAMKFNRSISPKVYITVKSLGKEWEFKIKDNGIGIDAKHLQKIFESFAKLHAKNEYPGSGIGLYFAKKIIGEHNGTIRAESTLGQGATFYVVLPK